MNQLLSGCEVSNEISGLASANLWAEEANAQIRFAIGESSMGFVLVARGEHGVCAILVGDDPGEQWDQENEGPPVFPAKSQDRDQFRDQSTLLDRHQTLQTKRAELR